MIALHNLQVAIWAEIGKLQMIALHKLQVAIAEMGTHR